ncbi:MAG: chemotaxis protein CheW [Desulfuromonadaceae bacterium]|nr:chemotaxis protein CheW [Desulfuromonadaceae bacterium]
MDRGLDKIQLACFSLGDKLFAVDIMRIKEIILPLKLSSLPRASDLLDGVINLRGNLIPVMNIRKRFQMPAGDDNIQSKLLIVSLARQILALMVDDVMEVISVSAEDIKPPLQMVSGVGMEFILGVCLSNDRVFMILDIDSLLGPQEMPEVSKSAG